MKPIEVGDYVSVLPGNYNERGDNLHAMRGVVKRVDDVFAYVKMDPYYRMRNLQRVFPGGLKRAKRPMDTKFEFRCAKVELLKRSKKGKKR